MSLPKVTVNDSKIGSLEGFLHNLPPTKDNRFEDGLQPKRKTHRVACFAPAKQPLFEDKNKSPLKISNFQYSKKGQGILINNNVQVEAVDRLDFPCVEIYGDNIKIKNNECCALSIDSISRYLDCSKCNAKIKPDTKSFADCPSCKIKQKVKACKPNMMVRVTIENQSDMKTHIVTMFKSQNLTVLPNAEQMMDDSLSEALLLLPETKVIYERHNKIIVYLKSTS